MSESLVDLLLVRLGREEEKRKVLKLLVTSLDLSVADAEDAVNNSPSVIREAVPMGEARVIQKDLYPYIDLLPRFDDEDDTGHETEEFEEDEEDEEEEIEEGSLEPEEDQEEEGDEDDYFDDGLPIEPVKREKEPAALQEEDDEDEDEPIQEDPILITSAGDEVRSTTRCHICGRTPTDGEKLAPCRTCSDLTCRDCFDRIAHVCSKCAASGKSIEHPNEGVEPERDEGLVFDTDPSGDASKGKEGGGRARYFFAGAVFLIALAAVFYFMDPMGLFGGEDTDSSLADVPLADTVAGPPVDTLDTEETDTLTVNPDTASVAIPENEDDFLALGSLILSEEYSSIEDPPPVAFRRTAPSSVGAEVLLEQSDIISEQLSVIAAWIPVELDDAVLLQYHDSTEVLVVVLTHPEETETRLELLRRISDWLTPSGIDQLVLLYRENRYQNTVIMSLVSTNFPLVQGVLSPVQFQNYLSFRDDCWESISGPVTQWLTEPQ